MIVKKMSNSELANEYRRLRNEARPVFNELKRRGFSIVEHHGHSDVTVTSFENIRIVKPTVIRL